MKTLQRLVEAHYNDFVALHNVRDFPKLHHVFAIISTESSWNPNAESPFARGLMQVSQIALQDINLRYGTSFTYDDMFDPAKNVWVGIRYLRWLYRALNRYEHAHILAVVAYNWGIGNVLKWLEIKDPCNSKIDESVPQETKNHLLDFLFWSECWKKELETR